MKRRDLLLRAAASAGACLLPLGALGPIWAAPVRFKVTRWEDTIVLPADPPHFTGGAVWGPETEGHREAIRLLQSDPSLHARKRRWCLTGEGTCPFVEEVTLADIRKMKAPRFKVPPLEAD